MNVAVDKAKLLAWLKKMPIDSTVEKAFVILSSEIESGLFDLIPTDVCPTCGGSGFSGLAALAGNGYDAVCDNCGGAGEVLKQELTADEARTP